MTVNELIAMLRRKVAIDPELGDREVGIEGCDCGASLDGVSREGETGLLWLRREDGFINVLGDKTPIEKE